MIADYSSFKFRTLNMFTLAVSCSGKEAVTTHSSYPAHDYRNPQHALRLRRDGALASGDRLVPHAGGGCPSGCRGRLLCPGAKTARAQIPADPRSYPAETTRE